jgi:hypothetical protein
MTAQPDTPGPDTGSYEVIHLGDQAAVVVPVTDFLRLRALQQAATPEDLEDAEDTAAVLEWKARDAAGPDDVRARQRSKAPAGHAPVSLRVDYDERAISQAAAFLDDPQGIRAVLDAIDWLADDPRPTGSFPYGSPDLRRLRVGRYPGPVRDHR